MIRDPEVIIKYVSQLKGDRGTWEAHWQEIGDWIIPRKNDINSFSQPGQKRGTNILDNTGMQSCELLAGALHGMLTNPLEEFFELTTGDDKLDSKDSVRMALQDRATRIHRCLNNSNFQTEVHEFYLDLCGFNTAGLTIMEDPLYDVIFQARFLKELFLCENNKGFVDEIFRVYFWDAKKIVQEFGVEKLPPSVMAAYTENKSDLFEIIHATYPNVDDYVLSDAKKNTYEKRSSKKFGFPIISQHVLVKEKLDLKIEGFHEMPWVVARWAKASGEVYGRGPGMNALPEVKMVNLMEDVMIRGAQKTIDPPLQLPDDGFILPIKTRPGGINFRRSGSSSRDGEIKPIFNDARIDFGVDLLRDRRQRIKEAFYVDQLQTPQVDRQTATEVNKRGDEQLRFLGPLVGRLHTEFLDPTISRVHAIMDRRKRFEPLPPELKGRQLQIRYSSIIAKMQRISSSRNITNTLQTIAPFVQMDPSIVSNFDCNAAARGIAQANSFPQEFLRNKNDVEEINKAHAAAAAKQQAQMDQAHRASVVKDALPAISDAARADNEVAGQ